MMRAVLVLVFWATTAAAQAGKAAPPQSKAPAAKTTSPAIKTTTPVTQTKTQAAPTKTAPAPVTTKTQPLATKAATKGQPGQVLAVRPEVPAKPPVIMRESFDYDAGGRRDPFFSLLPTAELRPTVSDLRLVGILYDESGRRPIAIMRDVSLGTQYRVTTGMTLGRMRVALIKRRAVIFSIEEFGLNRQDSLVLGDSTKARAR